MDVLLFSLIVIVNSLIEQTPNISKLRESLSNDKVNVTESINLKNKIWNNIDDFFDFGSSNKFGFANLSEKELEQYLEIISKLLKKGIIGWKYYEHNGQIEKHFIETSIGDQRLANAVPTKWNKIDKYY